MCRPDDFPPYGADRMSDLYSGPRCESCGGDHFPDDETHAQLERVGTFRELAPVELPDFTGWAREHYAPHTPINPLWHPAVIAECERINAEASWERRTEATNR